MTNKQKAWLMYALASISALSYMLIGMHGKQQTFDMFAVPGLFLIIGFAAGATYFRLKD